MRPPSTTLTYRWFQQVWNNGRREAIDALANTDLIVHGLATEAQPHGINGLEGFKLFYDDFRRQYENIHVHVENVICEENMESARCIVTARHRESGRDVNFAGMTQIKIRDEKIAEAWNNFDFLGLQLQLGYTLTDTAHAVH